MVWLRSLLPLLLVLINDAFGSPQNNSINSGFRTQSSFPNLREYILYLVHNPPPDANFNLLTVPIVSEFFKDPNLVNGLVDCFNLDLVCQYDGIAFWIDELSTRVTPGKPCRSCGRNFNRIINMAQREFRKSYSNQWNKLVQYIPEFFGGRRG